MEVAYFDFAKYCNKMDDGMVCHKMRDPDTAGKPGEYLRDFLEDKSQAVVAK